LAPSSSSAANAAAVTLPQHPRSIFKACLQHQDGTKTTTIPIAILSNSHICPITIDLV
jgi:hypothetical protein